MPGALDLPAEGRLPPFDGAIAWINSPPLTPKSVRGKVVLVDFWTYTCINWLRTLPYVRAWSEKYQNHGLVVIGVHTPEFTVEHTIDNIRRAVTAMRISYPVAVDSQLEKAHSPALRLVGDELAGEPHSVALSSSKVATPPVDPEGPYRWRCHGVALPFSTLYVHVGRYRPESWSPRTGDGSANAVAPGPVVSLARGNLAETESLDRP